MTPSSLSTTAMSGAGNAAKLVGLLLIFVSIVLVILEDEYYFAAYSAEKSRFQETLTALINKTTTSEAGPREEGPGSIALQKDITRGAVFIPPPASVSKTGQRWVHHLNSSAPRSPQPWDWVPITTANITTRYHRKEWLEVGQCSLGASGGSGGHQKPRWSCRANMKYYKFIMESGRELFSLEDTLELLAAQNNNAKRVSALVLGDSVSDQYYEGMNCNLLRNCWKSRGWNHTRKLAADNVWAFHRLSWFDSHFTNPTTGLEADLFLLRQYAPSPETPAIVHYLTCQVKEFDVIIFNWGLHFQRSQRAAGDLYAVFARRLSHALRCSPEELAKIGRPPLLMYIHPVAQHFPNTRCGYYEVNRTNLCYPIAADEFNETSCLRNWRGTDLRRVFTNKTDSTLTYIETPWSYSKDEVCAEPFRTPPPLGSTGSTPPEEVYDTVLHALPNYELTEPFYPNHPAYGDCTHFCYYPEYHEPFHDAMYLAAKLRDRTFPSRCAPLPASRRRVNTPEEGNLHCANVDFAEFQNGRNEGFDDQFSPRHVFWNLRTHPNVSRLFFPDATPSPTTIAKSDGITGTAVNGT